MTTQSFARHLDEVFTKAAEATPAPGVQAVLLQRGEVVWQGNFGMADVVRKRPVADDTMFCLASFGKLILAATVLRQSETATLDLDAPISRYIGAEVPGSSVVTTRMLLAQTAGYPNIYESAAVQPLLPMGFPGTSAGSDYDPDRPYTWSMFAPAYQEPQSPGQNWEYSNSGYILLAALLVRALGGEDQMRAVCSRFVHEPVDSAPIGEDQITLTRSERAAALLATGYEPQADGTFLAAYRRWSPAGIPTDLFGLPFGDGLYAGTALGAARFLDGLFVRSAYLHPETVEEMVEPSTQSIASKLLSDNDQTYGLGTMQERIGHRVWNGHPGMYGGFSANGSTDTSRGLTLVTLANGTWLHDEARPESHLTASGAVWQALARATEDTSP